MNPAASLHRSHLGTTRPPVMNRGASHRPVHSRSGKPSLSIADYMAELNERLRRHPMYLEGMHFPDPQPGSTPMLAAALAWEGPWDCLGVFSSVIEEVANEYDLEIPARVDFGRPHQRPANQQVTSA